MTVLFTCGFCTGDETASAKYKPVSFAPDEKYIIRLRFSFCSQAYLLSSCTGEMIQPSSERFFVNESELKPPLAAAGKSNTSGVDIAMLTFLLSIDNNIFADNTLNMRLSCL